jgi:predicted DNA-binding transcriptional regulator AlpA
MTKWHQQTQTSLSERRVLNINEAAMIAGVSPSTLKRRGQAGELQITRLSPRRVGIRADHLSAWLDARVASPIASRTEQASISSD